MSAYRKILLRAAASSALVFAAGAVRAEGPHAAPAAPAAAPSSASEMSAETKIHFDQGVKLYAEDDFRGALTEFRRAHDLSKRWTLLFNIGQCSYELGDYAGALRAFARYLSDGGSLIPQARRQRVEADMSELRTRVAKLKVDSTVQDADITLDDEVIGKTPLSSYTVNIGRHKIAVTKDGFVGAPKFVDLAGGDSPSLLFELKPVPSTPAPQDSTPEGQAGPSRLWLSLGLGALGVGATVATVFGIQALKKRSDLDDACKANVCPTREQSTYDSMNTSATVSTIGLGLAVVGAGVSIWTLLTPGSSSPPSRVQPTVGLGNVGVRGSF